MRKLMLSTVAMLSIGGTASAQPDAATMAPDFATCLQQARNALHGQASDAAQIDAYVSNGKFYFFNPFVSQAPTFAFWKCLRLKGYNFD